MQIKIKIRSVNQEEIIETSRIYVNAWREEYGEFIPEKVLFDLNAEKEAEESREWTFNGDKTNVHLVAVIENSIVGFIAAGMVKNGFPEDGCEVNNLFVRKQYQNMGIGIKLLYAAINKMQEFCCASVFIYSFHESVSNNFYRSLGGDVIKQEVQDFVGKPVNVDIFMWGIESLMEILKSKLKKYR